MFFFFKQKTAYERRISDWSSDVCSSDRRGHADKAVERGDELRHCRHRDAARDDKADGAADDDGDEDFREGGEIENRRVVCRNSGRREVIDGRNERHTLGHGVEGADALAKPVAPTRAKGPGQTTNPEA